MLSLKPLGKRILLRQVEGRKISKSIILPDSAREQNREGMIERVGDGVDFLLGGEHVIFGKWVGTDVLLEEGKFIILHQDDILGVYEKVAVKV